MKPLMRPFGFGTMRLPLTDPDNPASIDQAQVNRMADRFLEAGFTYVDTAYMYHNQMSEGAVRQAFVDRYPRDRFVLADKMPVAFVKTADDYPRFFAEQLERCGVQYFDYYLLHNLSRKSLGLAESTGAFAYMQQLKAEGKILHAGFSYHDTADLLEDLLQKHPEMEFVQLQLNYIDWENELIQARKNYEVCVRYGKPVVVMEPVKGGALADPPEEVRALFHSVDADASPASWAIRFAASLEGVFMVLSGMSNLAQMEDNLSFMRHFQPLGETERSVLDRAVALLQARIAIPCTGCRYCVNHEPGCPMQIAIPEYFGIYNTVKAYGQAWSTTLRYRNLRAEGHGAPGDCIGCGQCESHCPQRIPIIDWLQKLAGMEELMEKGSFPL